MDKTPAELRREHKRFRSLINQYTIVEAYYPGAKRSVKASKWNH
jgi:hypothetical protein